MMEKPSEVKKPKPKPKPSRDTTPSLSQEKNNSSPQIVDGNKLVEALLKHDQLLDEKLAGLQIKENDSAEKVSKLEKDLAELKEKSKDYDDQIALLEAKTSAASDNVTTKNIQKYLAIYERLKTDEKLFKISCNEELERLQLELATHDDATDANKVELQAQLDKYKERIEGGRIELASINRKVATLKRQIEQVPSRMELREYRLRFSELYNQVSATHRSTKQFFSLYNSLEDTKRYLEKELSLLNSIVDSFQLVSGSASGREDFLQQLQTTHDGMKETCSKVEKRLQTEKLGVEKMHMEFQKLLDLKVSYEKCLKELEADCKLNDQLLAECKAFEKPPTIATN